MRNGLQCYFLVDKSHVVCLVLRAIFYEEGMSMDSPWTDVGLLKTVPMCLLDRKCPCEFA